MFRDYPAVNLDTRVKSKDSAMIFRRRDRSRGYAQRRRQTVLSEHVFTC